MNLYRFGHLWRHRRWSVLPQSRWGSQVYHCQAAQNCWSFWRICHWWTSAGQYTNKTILIYKACSLLITSDSSKIVCKCRREATCMISADRSHEQWWICGPYKKQDQWWECLRWPQWLLPKTGELPIWSQNTGSKNLSTMTKSPKHLYSNYHIYSLLPR